MLKELVGIVSASGCVLYVMQRWKARRMAVETEKWPRAQGIITVSEKSDGFAHTGRSDSSKIRYSYNIGVIKYLGRNVSLLDTVRR
ncbi:hypothetical protein [Sphingomonas sp. KR3-1]|uniref:hypothetical protein n=1 Tax=Sphingomonas sp. KR3-1 TaxID=3156611 RepID=UPI0032B4CBC4